MESGKSFSEADEFGEMFKQAMEQSFNIVNNSIVQPANGIVFLCKQDKKTEEEVREEFRKLLAPDGGDIRARQDRIDTFAAAINEKLQNAAPGKWKYDQDRRSVIMYLSFISPDDNFMFKSTEARAFANGCEFGEDIGSGQTFRLDVYYRMCRELAEKIKNNDFLEYAKYNNCYYGTPKSKIDEYLNKGIDVILVIEVQGALEVKEKVKDALFIFILPPSMKELKRRLKSRGTEDEEKIMNRFKIAYKEINQITKYNYVVVNDEIEEAVTKVNSIIISEKCRVDRIEEVFLNNEEELIHETLMEKEFDNSVDEIGKK